MIKRLEKEIAKYTSAALAILILSKELLLLNKRQLKAANHMHFCII